MPPSPVNQPPLSVVSLSNSILSLVIFLWGVQFFRGSLLFSVHFGASNVANFILGTAIRPQNMTGNSTKRMNEFAMRRTTESGKEGELKRRENCSSHYSYCRRHAVRCFVRVCGKYQKRSRQGELPGREAEAGRGERYRNTLANAVACMCCALYVFMLNVIIRRTDKCI